MDQETKTQDPMLGTELQSVPTFSSLDYDEPRSWAHQEIYSYPNYDVGEFQKKLDKLFGLSETNLPIVRIVWPGDIKKCYSKFYVSWAGSGFGIDTELRAKYRYASIKIPGTVDIIDVPPPRWILEQFNHPGQYMASWEAARFDKAGREIRPAPPPNGYYSHLWTIARHDEKCCEEARASTKVCWGSYRQPDDQNIDMLAQAKQARDRDREIDTTKPLDERTIEAINRETEERLAKTDAIVEQHLREFIDENALEMIEFFTGRRASNRARKAFSIPANLKGKYRIEKENIERAELIIPRKNNE